MQANAKELISLKVFFILIAFVFGRIILKAPESAALLCLVSIVFLIFLKAPLKALSVFILLIPLSGTPFFNNTIMSMPGAKPLYLLSLFVITICILNYDKSIRMPTASVLFSVVLMSVLVIAVIRSLQYLQIINTFREETLSSNRYFLSAMVRPLIYFLPFVAVLKFAVDKSDIRFIVNSVLFSTVVLSLFIIFLLLFRIENFSDVKIVNAQYQLTLSMHRNGLANFYILSFPLVMSRFFLKKDFISVALIALCFICVGFLYSRTAYLTVILSTVFYLVLSNRKKYLPFIMVFVLLAGLIMARSIIERIYMGIDTGDRNEITAGRTDDIWLPLLKEIISNPKKLFVGEGRYGILNSNASRSGSILDVTHPHNMYLELIVDSGLIGFIAIIPFMSFFFYRFYKSIPFFFDSDIKEYQYAVVVSTAAYFISGLTGRSLFPESNNSYFWLILAIGISLLRVGNIPRPE